jgi:tape measure domain-containing protein
MAIATDRLHTIVTLDAGNYQANSAKVVAATAKMKAAGVGDGRALSGIGSFATAGLGALSTVATVAAAGLAASAVAIGGLGAASLQAYGNLERLALGLNAVEGSAEIAAQRMAELRDLAKAPGLGFSEAVGAFGQLRNAGASAGFSQSIIKELANANARGGGDSATFARIMQAVAQSLNSPFLQGDEMRQFRENRLPVDAALRSRFGTSDSEQLSKQGVTSAMAIQAIVEEFSKMERVQGGLTNSFENLTDTVNIALAAIGQGFAPAVMSIVNSLSTAFSELTDSGVLKLFGETLAKIGNEVGQAFTAAGGGISVSEALIEFGAVVIDVASLMGQVSAKLAAIVNAIPVVNSLIPGLEFLSGGAGMEFRTNALAALGRIQSGGSGASLDQFTNGITSAGATNPVQQRQLMAQEQIARNTEQLVRFEQTALGGGELLRRGISVSDANRYNSGGGSSSNAESNLVGAIKAMIAQNVARGL